MSEEESVYHELESPEQIEDLMQPGGGAAIIDFWSPSCGPCMAMAPDFAAVAEEFDEDPIMFCKINVGESPHLAAPFKIRSTPTVLFVNDGEVLDAVVGRMDGNRLYKRAEWLLKKSTGGGILSRLFGGGRKSE